MAFEERWFIASRNDKACAIWNSYMGGTLVTSRLYTGSFTNNKAYLYKKEKLFSLGTTVWDFVDPLVLSIENEHLLVRLEPPAGEGSVREITFRHIKDPSNQAKPTPDGSFWSEKQNAPEIDELKQCAKAL